MGIVTKRPSREALYMKIALDTARRSTCPRAQVGCVLVHNGAVLAVAYNGAPSEASHCLDVGCEIDGGHCVRATHAEANAIAVCARQGIATEGSIAYVTHVPCASCAKLLYRAGIRHVWFLYEYGDLEVTRKVIPSLQLIQFQESLAAFD